MPKVTRITEESYNEIVVFNPNSKGNRLIGKFSVDEVLKMQADEIAWIILFNDVISANDKQKISDYIKNVVYVNRNNDSARYEEAYKYVRLNSKFRYLFFQCRIWNERILNALNQLKYIDLINNIMPKYEEYLMYRVTATAHAVNFLQRVATHTGLEIFKNELSAEVLNAELLGVADGEKNNIFITFDEKKGLFKYNDTALVFNRNNIISVVNEDYQKAKAFIETLEEWVETNNLIDFIPCEMVQSIDFIKHPEKKNYIPNKYFKSEYNRLFKENPNEAKKIKKYAVFPDYNKVKINQKFQSGLAVEFMNF